MAHLKLDMKLDNDAFWTDSDVGEGGLAQAQMRLDREAVAEVLRDVAEDIANGMIYYSEPHIRDANGNVVGTIDLNLSGEVE